MENVRTDGHLALLQQNPTASVIMSIITHLSECIVFQNKDDT